MEGRTCIEMHCQVRVMVMMLAPTVTVIDTIRLRSLMDLLESRFSTIHFQRDQQYVGELSVLYMLGGPTEDWSEFQFHRQTHAVIGFCDVRPEHDSPDQTYEAFKLTFSRGKAIKRILIALDPQNLLADAVLPSDMYSISATDEERIAARLAPLIADLVQHIVNNLVNFITQRQSDKGPGEVRLVTPIQDQDASVFGSQVFGNLRRRNVARYDKQIGDLHLLMRKYTQAETFYQSAIRALRDVSDFLWLAGALEGSAICNAMQSDQLEEAFGKYNEAIELYSKLPAAAAVMKFEAIFKLTRLLIQTGNRQRALKLLGSINFVSFEGIADNWRETIALVMATLYQTLGCTRKAGLCLYYAARYQMESGTQASRALRTLLKAAESYGIAKLSEILDNSLVESVQEIPSHGGWPVLQSVILHTIVDVLRGLKDHGRLARCVAYYSHRIQRKETKQDFLELLSLVESIPPVSVYPLAFKNCPTILKVELRERDFTANAAKSTAGMLVNSMRHISRASKSPPIWVQNETSEAIISMYNSWDRELSVEGITLFTGQRSDFHCYPASIVIPPASQKSVKLRCKATGTGSFTLTGCHTRVFGVDTFHKFDEKKVDVIAALPQLNVTHSLGTDSPLWLFDGTRQVCRLTFENISGISIDKLKLTFIKLSDKTSSSVVVAASHIQDSGDEMSALLKFDAFKLDLSRVRAILPLRPRSSSTVDLLIETFQEASQGIDLAVEYQSVNSSSGETSRNRKTTISIPLKIQPCLLLGNLDVLLPTGDHASDQSRSATTAPRETLDHCIVAFDVSNESDVSLSIEYGPSNSSGPASRDVIQAGCTKRAHVIIERFSLEESSWNVEQVVPRQGNRKVVVKDRAQLQLEAYSARLRELLVVNWFLESPRASGRASALGLKLNDETIERIKPTPRRVSFTVSPFLGVHQNHDFTVALHAPVLISVEAHTSIEHDTLEVAFYQDLLTGSTVRDLRHSMVINGLTVIKGPATAGCVRHSLSVVFLTEGAFSFCLLNSLGEFACHSSMIYVVDPAWPSEAE
eukprot:m.298471 g.298471  ORF g.298471 m.298471 type:complete len:1039 (-) comp55175_c0_seq9:24-3140(-)